MTLVDISKLTFEPFFDTETGETIDYISAQDLWRAPKIDPVNHAEWIVKTASSYAAPNSFYVSNVCSHCGTLDHCDLVPIDLWESGYKNRYKPDLNPFCRKCGYKMDLRELYEQYKLRWCADRGYSLEEVDHEHGINGECYVCFTEWYNNEYLESRGE